MHCSTTQALFILCKVAEGACHVCCSYYGHLSQRFCNINRTYQELFEQCFSKQYGLIHRLETNKLRNVARLFAVHSQGSLALQC